jgi:chromosome partitioning protein
MIIVIGGIKGGSGKTTVATNLAIIRAAHGRGVLLIDADRQGTATDFSTLRRDRGAGSARYTCVPLVGRALHTDAPRLIARHDDVIIDTDGQDEESQRIALARADVLLVPFVPRSFDFWTLDRVARRVEDIWAVNRRLRACAFLNRVDARGRANDDAEDVLRESGVLEVLPARLGARRAFGTAAAQGLAVTELHPPDRKATDEVLALYTSVFESRQEDAD